VFLLSLPLSVSLILLLFQLGPLSSVLFPFSNSLLTQAFKEVTCKGGLDGFLCKRRLLQLGVLLVLGERKSHLFFLFLHLYPLLNVISCVWVFFFCLWSFTFSHSNINFILEIKKTSHFILDFSNSLRYFFLISDSLSQVSSSIYKLHYKMGILLFCNSSSQSRIFMSFTSNFRSCMTSTGIWGST